MWKGDRGVTRGRKAVVVADEKCDAITHLPHVGHREHCFFTLTDEQRRCQDSSNPANSLVLPGPKECHVFAKTIIRGLAVVSLVSAMVDGPCGGRGGAHSQPLAGRQDGQRLGDGRQRRRRRQLPGHPLCRSRRSASCAGNPRSRSRRGAGSGRQPPTATAARPWSAPTALDRPRRTACSSTCSGRPGRRRPCGCPSTSSSTVVAWSTAVPIRPTGRSSCERPMPSSVTLNYRLGVFGFLALPSLEKVPGDGNYGLMDQQAALRVGPTKYHRVRWQSVQGSPSAENPPVPSRCAPTWSRRCREDCSRRQ